MKGGGKIDARVLVWATVFTMGNVKRRVAL